MLSYLLIALLAAVLVALAVWERQVRTQTVAGVQQEIGELEAAHADLARRRQVLQAAVLPEAPARRA